MRCDRIYCWEAGNVADAMVAAAGRIYERVLSAEERIPWEWIERSLLKRDDPTGRRRHLILAADEGQVNDPAGLAGFAYGMHIPGYGGYLCYLGVADDARRQGVGRRLIEQFFQAVRADADKAREPLPFVIWESKKPDPEAPEADRKIWTARLKLFDRVGGLWIEGVNFLSPSWLGGADHPVPLQLFLKPMDTPAGSFDANRLRSIVGGLHEQIYRHHPGDALYQASLPAGCQPRLKSPLAAESPPAAVMAC